MKIGLVCHEYPPAPHGGIGLLTQALARGMAEAGHRVTVLGFGPRAEERDDGGVRVVTLRFHPWPRLGGLYNRWRLHRWLSRAARAGEIEIIETPEYEGPLPFSFSACPVVVRLNLSTALIAAQAGYPPDRRVRRYEELTLRRHPHWLAVSRYILEQTQKTFALCPREVAVVLNPAPPLPPPAALEVANDFLLYVGTLSSRKGALLVAEAVRPLLQADPSLHLYYLGRPAVEAGEAVDVRLRRYFGGELSRQVHFLGFVRREELSAYLHRARALLAPSRLEAGPLVVAEGMQAGLPVICSREGIGPEIIRDGENGLLVDAENPAALRQRVLFLLQNRAAAEAIGRKAREMAQRLLTIDRSMRETLAFYQRVLAGWREK